MNTSRSGIWWSTDRDEHVAGTLIYSDGRWQLDTIGTLPTNARWTDGLSLVPPTAIFGACGGMRYTLHGAYLTDSSGPVRNFTVQNDERDRENNQSSQRWSIDRLLKGDALPLETRYSSATFELTGLSSLWPFTGFTPGTDVTFDTYQQPEPSVVDCGDGLTLSVGTSATGHSGPRSNAFTEHVAVVVHSESGFTLDRLMEYIVTPLRVLIAIAVHNRVECYNLRLQPFGNDNPATFTYPIEVDPDVYDTSIEPRHGYAPMFTFKEIDVAILARWLRLAEENRVPLAVAEPRLESGSLQSQVVEAVNAAETLHRSLHTEDGSPLANKVFKALKTSGLSDPERLKVRSAVKMTDVTLERRLSELADGLGENFCTWFFQGRAGDWAKVASHVRNVLSHGYLTPHRVHRDLPALVGVLRLTQAVICLRLLVEAGLPTDTALIEVIKKDPQYRALMLQSVADWRQLAAQLSNTADSAAK